jgi:hypothetical protein
MDLGCILWLSAQPWGWAPYHYGGWLFDASCGGWFYSPPIYFSNPPYMLGPRRRSPLPIHPPRPVYQPATAVFVKQGGKLGVVPMHPSDNPGKTPKNLDHGVFSISPTGTGTETLVNNEPGKKWGTLKSAPRTAMENSLTRMEPPVRLSRSIAEAKPRAAGGSLGKDSSIAYDSKDHRYVNSNGNAGQTNLQDKVSSTVKPAIKSEQATNGVVSTSSVQPAGSVIAGEKRTSVPQPPATSHATSTPARTIVPPPAPRASGGGGSRSGNGGWGGSSSGANGAGRSSSSGSTASPSHSSGASSHPSGGSSHPSSSGRPH